MRVAAPSYACGCGGACSGCASSIARAPAHCEQARHRVPDPTHTNGVGLDHEVCSGSSGFRRSLPCNAASRRRHPGMHFLSPGRFFCASSVYNIVLHLEYGMSGVSSQRRLTALAKRRSRRQRTARYEYWYDSHHTGALRVLDHGTMQIYGSDPAEAHWKVPFQYGRTRNELEVHFDSKKTHRVHQCMKPVYRCRRQILKWPDGNEWRRIRVNPNRVLQQVMCAATKRCSSGGAMSRRKNRR